jgi:predicted membrane-bound spermidine synthase
MSPDEYIIASRVPHMIRPQEFGLWSIQRVKADNSLSQYMLGGFDDYTLLRRYTASTIHLEGGGEIVMEDSARELRKHLPIWMTARGRVLVTGLGLGCVVRGLLANPQVSAIDVIEIDKSIIRVIGPEFANNQRVTIHHDDALNWRPCGARFDFAWHDIWSDEGAGHPHLQRLHAQLFIKYRRIAKVQGAWAFPRELARLYSRHLPLIGLPKFRESKRLPI